MPEVSAAVDTKEDVDKEDDGEKREIGKLAVWSVSSNKPGNGVEMLRDNNLGTYWQSDGAQPHLVNIQFQKKVRLQVGCSKLQYMLISRLMKAIHLTKYQFAPVTLSMIYGKSRWWI